VEKPNISSYVSQRMNFMDEIGGIVATLKAIQESLEKSNASDVEMNMVICVAIVRIKAGLCI